MSKFIKTLIIINGLLIPVIIIVLLVSLFMSVNHNSYRDTQTGVLTQNVVTKDTGFVAKQGLDYTAPEPIDGTENYYMPISVKTYDKPENVTSGSGSSLELTKGSRYHEEGSYFNIIFLDKNFNVLRRLLNRKSAILEIVHPHNDETMKLDNTVKNLAYKIVFEDTNKDGQLDEKDAADVYISDIDGANFTRVTRNMDIQSVCFDLKNTSLCINYTDRKDIPEEYKELKFATYNIQEKKLVLLRGISTEIKSIKGILNAK